MTRPRLDRVWSHVGLDQWTEAQREARADALRARLRDVREAMKECDRAWEARAHRWINGALREISRCVNWQEGE